MSKDQYSPAKRPNPVGIPSIFDGIPVAVLSDAIDALGLANPLLQNVRQLSGARIAGRARTVGRANILFQSKQTDIDMGTQKVIDESSTGDIMVIATQSDPSSAVWGGNMATRAAAVGVIGIVTDGAVRDLDEMEDFGISVYGQATTPRQSNKRMATFSINEPVMVGGVLVRPGDFIIGDGDGVIAITVEQADAIAAKGREILKIEQTMQQYIREGNLLVGAVQKYKQR